MCSKCERDKPLFAKPTFEKDSSSEGDEIDEKTNKYLDTKSLLNLL